MNKFAVGLVLSGALTAITSPVWMPLYNAMPTSEVAEEQAPKMTNEEFEKRLAMAAEINKQEAQAAAAQEETKETAQAQADPLADWAVRAYEADQAHQDKCWDQLEERGKWHVDTDCYTVEY
jgi:phosphoserine phosphatase